MIRLDGLGKTFDGGTSWAVRDLSLTVAEGETLVLLGSSGCGKTTTLKMVNRLIEPSTGTVEVDGNDVTQGDPIALRRSIGCVFQSPCLFPHLTIEDNVAIVLQLMGRGKTERRERAAELLALVDLPPADFAKRYPPQLSGGQQQRVGVARALAADPAYLLMDEPFGALDAATRPALRELVLDIRRERDTAVLFVTHDIDEALLLADRVVVLSGRPGTVAGEIRLDAPRPRDPASRAFVEQHLAARALLGGSVV